MVRRATKGELRFVLASLVIPEGVKFLWSQHWVLDPKGHGCWLTHEQLAERLGLPVRTVEDRRLDMMHHGLLARIPEGRTQARGYVATVPADEPDCHFSGASPDPDRIVRGRVALDSYIGRWRPPDKGRGTASAVTSAGKSGGKSSGKSAGTSAVGSDSYAFESQGDQPSFAVEVEGREADEASRNGGKSEADEGPTSDEISEAGFVNIHEQRRRAREVS